MEKLKLFEMFSGYGGASFGLKKAGIPFDCVGISEIDKYAWQCFIQNHKGYNYGDCSKINTDELPDFDLLTGGFPCQDVSISGNRDLSKGRTNLYQEIIRIAEAKKPKYMLLENVKGLLSMEVDERSLIHIIVNDLKKIGYGVCWKVLNSKDFGIPQNRERIWFVCKLGGWDFMEFQFPNPIELKIFLKDILEKDIDKKYYLSLRRLEHQKERLEKGWNIHRYNKKDKYIGCICSGYYKLSQQQQPYIIENDKLNQKTRDIPTAINIAQEIADKEQKPVQLDLMHLQHGEIRPLSTYIPQNLDIHRCLQSGEPKEILIEPKILDCYNNKIKEDGVCITLTEPHHNNLRLIENNSIRKLTPKECFRLMGFLNDEINLDGLSDTQRYKLAGNGWDINLVSKIFKQMFKEKQEVLI